MTGPDHFREGERLLKQCAEFSSGERRGSIATEANAHFLAALVALHVAEKQPDSVSWNEATHQ